MPAVDAVIIAEEIRHCWGRGNLKEKVEEVPKFPTGFHSRRTELVRN